MSIENIQPNEILFFGDSKYDYDVSSEMNTNFIGVLTERDDLKYIDCKKIKDYAEFM